MIGGTILAISLALLVGGMGLFVIVAAVKFALGTL